MPKPDAPPIAAAPDAAAAGRPAKGAGKVSREDRLKAALKANMARRKAQARAKGRSATGQDDNTQDE